MHFQICLNTSPSQFLHYLHIMSQLIASAYYMLRKKANSNHVVGILCDFYLKSAVILCKQSWEGKQWNNTQSMNTHRHIHLSRSIRKHKVIQYASLKKAYNCQESHIIKNTNALLKLYQYWSKEVWQCCGFLPPTGLHCTSNTMGTLLSSFKLSQQFIWAFLGIFINCILKL